MQCNRYDIGICLDIDLALALQNAWAVKLKLTLAFAVVRILSCVATAGKNLKHLRCPEVSQSCFPWRYLQLGCLSLLTLAIRTSSSTTATATAVSISISISILIFEQWM